MVEALPRGWPGRALVAGLATAAIGTAWDLWLLVDHLGANVYDTDFRAYTVAARIGLTHGWARIYDWHLNYVMNVAIYPPGRGWTQVPFFSSPPPVAWLALPFLAIPLDAATWLWTGLELGLLVLAGWLAVAGRSAVRALAVLALLGAFPAEHGLALGQAAVLVAASYGIGAWLLRHDRDVAAGVVLALVCLKPQLGLLVPVALLSMRRYQALAAWLMAVALLAAVSVALLGSSGVKDAWLALNSESTLPFNYTMTWKGVFGGSEVSLVVEAGIASLAAAAIWLWRRGTSATPLAVAAIGSVAASPYLHTQDLLVLLVGALLLASSIEGWAWLACASMFVAAEFVWVWGPIPLLLVELVVLVALLVARHPYVTGRAPAGGAVLRERPS